MLCSQPVAPTLPEPEYPARPMLCPRSVITDDPVAAEFGTLTMLTTPTAAEYPSLTLPARCNTVNDTLRLPITAAIAWHTTDESDSHIVPSLAVRPILDDTE